MKPRAFDPVRTPIVRFILIIGATSISAGSILNRAACGMLVLFLMIGLNLTRGQTPSPAAGAPAEPDWLSGRSLKPTYTEGAGLIIEHRCVSCHRPGEVAPISFLTYEEIKDWSLSSNTPMAALIASREMPPWPADPSVGDLANSRLLSETEIELLLRWFDDEDNVLRFMAFPTEQMDVVDAINNPTRADALRYQWAMAVELLTFAEVRIENFTTLHLEKHFTWHGDVLIIDIERSEVKNRQDIKSEIPGPVAAHVKQYIDHYQPLLTKDPSLWLFPGKSGSSKSASPLRQQLKTTTFEGVGIAFHPHVFRKIGPKIFL
ncbi:hypothetical protein IIC65_04915, partial [Candidatus Sumerlaeota bacterium]|nr:hypothetical protein [Candidatus Sumerlaeota bacterium]